MYNVSLLLAQMSNNIQFDSKIIIFQSIHLTPHSEKVKMNPSSFSIK